MAQYLITYNGKNYRVNAKTASEAQSIARNALRVPRDQLYQLVPVFVSPVIKALWGEAA